MIMVAHISHCFSAVVLCNIFFLQMTLLHSSETHESMSSSFSHEEMNKLFEAAPCRLSLENLVSGTDVVGAMAQEDLASKPSLSEYYHVDESDYSSECIDYHVDESDYSSECIDYHVDKSDYISECIDYHVDESDYSSECIDDHFDESDYSSECIDYHVIA